MLFVLPDEVQWRSVSHFISLLNQMSIALNFMALFGRDDLVICIVYPYFLAILKSQLPILNVPAFPNVCCDE